MTSATASKVTTELLQQRSRDVLIERLGVVMQDLSPDEAVAFLADLLLTMGADRDQLKARLVSLLASQFGRSSEKTTAAQLDLFATALRLVEGRPSADPAAKAGAGSPSEAAPAPPSAADLIGLTNQEVTDEAAAQRAKAQQARLARREAMRLEAATDDGAVPWPTNLPVREVYLPVPPGHVNCSDCAQGRHVLRHERSWRLECSTTAEVVVTFTPVVVCGSHHGGPLTAPVPPKPVDKGHMGFSLAARLLWLRLTHNLPVRRLAEMMQADGVPVSEGMIHTLICVSGERAKPLVEAIHHQVQQAALVNLDDTHTDVHEGEKERTRKRARVWLALGDERYAWFFATRTWQTKEAEAALGRLSGVLQGDGYRGFPRMAARGGNRLAGCMSHLRRKLRKAVLARDPRAAHAMALVQGLYRVEELADLRGYGPEQRLALRQERSVTIMAELLDWARTVEPSIETKGPLGQAWTYLRNQREPLQVFLTDGTVTIDNNAAERGLRRITIGRKLWLFFRDQDKLEHVARLMSIVTTARLHRVNELEYLQWVLEQLARREWSAAAAAALLPDAWSAEREKQRQEVAAADD